MPRLYFDVAHMLAGGLVLVSFMMLYQNRLYALLNIFALQAVVLALSVAWQAWIQEAYHLFVTAAGPPPVGLLARVLNIGHTSGADLLAGVLGAGDALNDIVGPARPNAHQQVHGKALISEGAF